MNYIIVFSLLSILLMMSFNSMNVETVKAKNEILIDKEKSNLDKVETATFGLG